MRTLTQRIVSVSKLHRAVIAAVGLALVVSASGCKVGPDYCAAPAQIHERWLYADDDPRISSDTADYSNWWTTFNDPTINTIVQLIEDQNLTLRSAAFRIQAARAQRGIAAGNLFPQVQEAFGAYSRVNTSQTVATFAPILPTNFDFYTTGFDAAWELDFWGRFRRAVEAADGDLQASIASFDDILVILQAEAVATYVQVWTLERRLELARDNVEIQQGSFDLADVRFRRGATTELDVQQAKSNLDRTEALVPGFEAGLQQAKNQLCVLLGIPPTDLSDLLGGPKPIPLAPESIAAGIPAELLQRRPDIRRAHFQASAQSARIGIAITDLYPRFLISGSLGTDSADFDKLFRSASFSGDITPGFRWNILNYGRLKNNIRVQESLFYESLTNYENTVLAAYQEVEDGLIDFTKSHDIELELGESADAAARAVEIARTQYRDGAIDFNQVFTLESLLVSQQDAHAVAQADIALALIRVYKALGGGWQVRAFGNYGNGVPIPLDGGDLPAEPNDADPFVAPPAPGAANEAGNARAGKKWSGKFVTTVGRTEKAERPEHSKARSDVDGQTQSALKTRTADVAAKPAEPPKLPEMPSSAKRFLPRPADLSEQDESDGEAQADQPNEEQAAAETTEETTE